MRKSKKENKIEYWGGVLLGILLSLLGTHKILTGRPGIRGGVEIPAWTGWVELPVGLWILFHAVRALWRTRNTPDPPEPPVNIREEAARAEAELDAMYLREHGKLPDKTRKDY